MDTGTSSTEGRSTHRADGVREFTLGDGARLAYRWDGPVGAPVLVLSNALGTSLGMWDAQIGAFSRTHRVLRYDTRGHGRSSSPPGAYSIDRLGRDVLELLDGLSVPRVHFCGLSLGGMIGQWLAVHAHERIERLVLANTAPYLGPAEAWQARIETVMRDGMDAVADASVARWFTPRFSTAHPREVAELREALVSMSRGGYAGCCAAIRDMDLRPIARLIHAPTLLIVGVQDPSTSPRDAALLAGPMPRPPERVDLRAAELSNVERPGEFTRAVLDFLAPSHLEQGAATL